MSLLTVPQTFALIQAALALPRASWPHAHHKLWKRLPADAQKWFLDHGGHPPRHLEPMAQLLVKGGKKNFREMFLALITENKIVLLATTVVGLLCPPSGRDPGGPNTSGLITPATITEDGRFHVVIRE